MICLGDEIFCYYWRGRILLATFFLVKDFRLAILMFSHQLVKSTCLDLKVFQLLVICREDEIVFYYWRRRIICNCNYLSMNPMGLNLKKSEQFLY